MTTNPLGQQANPHAQPSAASAWRLCDFDYSLPPELIAQQPAPQRNASRLLDGGEGRCADLRFTDLPSLLRAGDLLVVNNTQVIKARLLGRKAASGGGVEALIERVVPVGTPLGHGQASQPHEVWAHVRASKSPGPGTRIVFGADAGAALSSGGAGSGFEAEVLGRTGADNALFRLRLPSEPLALLQRHGHVPLPPYITHADSAEDEARYQAVFAQRPGAVAAPTASLHFDEAMLATLAAMGVQRTAVTLHVGAGTFQPVRNENLAEHRMHSEWYEVGADAVAAIQAARARGGRVVAVGTTALRALESAALRASLRASVACSAAAASPGNELAPCSGETDLFITPGYRLRVVDALITNFHLPKSTLMMLVSALAGHAHIQHLYRHAVEQRYRFFSYGDCMWLTRSGAGA